MKIEMICKNYKLAKRLSDVMTVKLNRLDKFFPDSKTPIKVVMSTDNGKRCKMEVSINFYGAHIRSEVSGDTMYYIIDDIIPKLERQIVKHRAKLSRKQSLPLIIEDVEIEEEINKETEYFNQIAKVKKFPIQSIEVKEAVEELEMVGHDFYLFVNSATGNVEAVYRRKDGTLGLLQPYVE